MDELRLCQIPDCENEVRVKPNGVAVCERCTERILTEVDERAEEMGLPVVFRGGLPDVDALSDNILAAMNRPWSSRDGYQHAARSPLVPVVTLRGDGSINID